MAVNNHRLRIPPEFVFKKESKFLTVNAISRNIFFFTEKKIDEYVGTSEMSNAVSLTYSSDVFNGKDPQFSLQRKLSYQVRSKKWNDLMRDCNNQYVVFEKFNLFLQKEFDSVLTGVRNAIHYQMKVRREEWFDCRIQKKYLEIQYLNPLFWAIYECAMVCFCFVFFGYYFFLINLFQLLFLSNLACSFRTLWKKEKKQKLMNITDKGKDNELCYEGCQI